jgi:hypothetical protein
MSVALRGNLKDFGIAEVFQLIGQQGKTGVLEVTSDDARVQLRFDGGRVVSATPIGVHEHFALGEMLVRCGLVTREQLEGLEPERASTSTPLPRLLFQAGIVSVPEIEEIEELLTRETIFQLLRWQGGSFHFSAQEVEHEREPGTLLGAEQILIDGLRMVDEFRAFRALVPSDETVFQRSGPFERWRDAALDASSRQIAASERVYLLVDGRLPVRRVIDLSRLGSFEATRILAELARAGALAPLKPEQLERTRRRRRVVAPPVSPLERVLAQGLPFALSGLLLLVALWTGRADPHESALAWRGPLAEARAGFALRRVRNALDAHRYAFGGAPGRLEELERQGFLARDALTPAEGGSYYYAADARGAVVLAPER